MAVTDDIAVKAADRSYAGDEEIPGLGWLFFAGTMLGLAGMMRILDAIWAFSYNGNLPEKLQDSVLGDSLTTYGWVWLLVGVLLIVSSVLVLSKSQFARWFGIMAAGVMTVSAMVWMPYYPIWALTYVLLGCLTIYGLSVYGGRDS
jgi:hypothetical protein